MAKKLSEWLDEFAEGGADINTPEDWPKTYHGTGGEQIQADWNQKDNSAKDFIKNKPVIPDVVSGTNDGNNWTSLTIGNETHNLASEINITAQEIEEYFNEYCNVQALITEEVISDETINVLNLENADVEINPSTGNLELIFNTDNVETELNILNIE